MVRERASGVPGNVIVHEIPLASLLPNDGAYSAVCCGCGVSIIVTLLHRINLCNRCELLPAIKKDCNECDK